MLKRSFDIVVAAIALLVTSPIMLVASLLILGEDGWPIIYRGERIGRFGRPFAMLKFRTMVKNASMLGGTSSAADDPRITRAGRTLRKYKIDELPQLVNVLRGEMSIVGPRPQVRWAVELYTPEQRALLSVRPGITDYASICFRDEGELLRGSDDPDRDYLDKIAPEKIRLGLEYVHNHSMLIDVKLILKTLAALLPTRAPGNRPRYEAKA